MREPSRNLEDTVTGQGPSEQGAEAQSPVDRQREEGDEGKPERIDFLMLAKAADRQAITFAQRSWFGKWSHNYHAFRGEHFEGSKYLSDDFKARSKIFVPKTRNAVTKDAASAAASLFATVNAVNVTAGDESNKMEAANADVMQELINYRLDRTSGKNSISWFMVAMGARQDSQM